MPNTKRWLLALSLICVVTLSLFAVGKLALAQDGVYLPMMRNGDPAATPSPTITTTPTATTTPTVTPTTTPTATPVGTPIAIDLHVDDDNRTPKEDGSAQHPYNTVQEAIVAAHKGDNIAVAAGTYTENIRIQGRVLHLFGGYLGADVDAYANGDGGDFDVRDPAANSTHLRGDRTDSVVTLINAGATVLDGFRITRGTRSLIPEFGEVGGGLYVSGGSPIISHNLIENNDTRPSGSGLSDSVGGGIFADRSDISILDNLIRNNTSGRGAGIGVNGGEVLIHGNTVLSNTGVSDHGGGVYVFAPHAEITRNLIQGNEIGRALGYGWGGGIVIFGDPNLPGATSALLSFNTVTENYAPSVGGGVFVDDGALATLDHELIYNNVCPDGGTTGGVGLYVDGYGDIGSRVTVIHTTIAGHHCTTQGGNGLYVEVHSGVTISNSIFWDNNGDDFYVDPSSGITVTYTTAEEAQPGVGNLSTDPRFADPDQHDYHLQSTVGRWDPTANGGEGDWVIDTKNSPAIDAADPASPFAEEPSPNGGRANMGVYGNTAEASKSPSP